MSSNSKKFSNNAQFLISKRGDLYSRVLIYMALNTDNDSEEFFHSNQRIAKNIGANKKYVSQIIQKLKKDREINVSLSYNGLEQERTITWVNNYEWKHIRDNWSINFGSTPKKQEGYGSNIDIGIPKKQEGSPKIYRGNNKDTYLDTLINTSFNKEKQEEIDKEIRSGKI